ncbi:MAG: hypothetical protein KBS45_01055 [Clostridiales bacterium]|nr:hypothetical protein [Candidatus Coliplasma caballi]
MKTKEELLALKEEYDRLNTLLQELSEDELREVTGGYDPLLPGFITVEGCQRPKTRQTLSLAGNYRQEQCGRSQRHASRPARTRRRRADHGQRAQRRNDPLIEWKERILMFHVKHQKSPKSRCST